MKAIFLDIDGVLNNEKHILLLYDLLGKNQYFKLRQACGNTPLNYEACRLVDELATETDAKIIISSTWRVSSEDIEFAQEQFINKFYAKTPILHTIRGEEIELFLKNHKEIDNYVIIDDDSDMLEKQLDHFVVIDRYNGFTLDDYKKCKEILNEKFD